MAIVYGLYNHTKRQRYYGTTTRALSERVEDHASGQVKATAHWDFDRDYIVSKTIAKGLSQQRATRKAHQLEQRKTPRGWRTIQTGGM